MQIEMSLLILAMSMIQGNEYVSTTVYTSQIPQEIF